MFPLPKQCPESALHTYMSKAIIRYNTLALSENLKNEKNLMSSVTKHSSDIFRLLADPRWKKNSQPPLCSSNPPPFCSDDIISSKMLRVKMIKTVKMIKVTKAMKMIEMILEERDASSFFAKGKCIPLCKAV